MNRVLKKKYIAAVGVILLLFGIAAGLLLIQQSQEIREKAASQN